MEFRIADTFTDSLAQLTGDEQKAVKTTAFDLQLNPANPGMSFHKLDKAKDRNFWSVRAEQQHPTYRPQERFKPIAMLCRASRRCLSIGRNGGSLKHIPRPAPLSWLRFEKRCGRSSSQCTFRHMPAVEPKPVADRKLLFPAVN